MILFPYETRIEPSAWGWDLWNASRPIPLPVSHIKFLKYPLTNRSIRRRTSVSATSKEILKNKCWTRPDIGVLFYLLVSAKETNQWERIRLDTFSALSRKWYFKWHLGINSTVNRPLKTIFLGLLTAEQ